MLNFDSGRLSHAYIADGSTADIIAQAVVCSNRNDTGSCAVCAHCRKASQNLHPDIIYVSKPSDKRDIVVDQIRDLKKDVIVIPNEAQQKAYVINDAHLMNISAQNAFLRILEEPPHHVVFILKTAFPTQLLPTILSRCIPIKSEQNTEAETELVSPVDDCEIINTVSRFYKALADGNTAIAEFMFALEKLNKEQFGEFISAARSKAALLLGNSPDNSDKVSMKTVAKAEKLLAQANGFLDLNVNVGHISGFICANLITE